MVLASHKDRHTLKSAEGRGSGAESRERTKCLAATVLSLGAGHSMTSPASSVCDNTHHTAHYGCSPEAPWPSADRGSITQAWLKARAAGLSPTALKAGRYHLTRVPTQNHCLVTSFAQDPVENKTPLHTPQKAGHSNSLENTQKPRAKARPL